ncbi:hypothetical protein B0H19DRAFT_1374792 [Mycena capillaripes]|nr:hypothetical protein B0H19DRAFT_1374792 [Mycena capillaripes]
MRAQLHATWPRRLAMPVESLFSDSLRDGDGFDLTLPMLASLTHLDVFEVTNDLTLGSSRTSLALLPMLTHLAFGELDGASLASTISKCPKVKVLVRKFMRHLILELFRILSSGDLGKLDEQFMLIFLASDEYMLDWKTSTQGGMDIWARADAFVAKKRRGEIEPNWRHWIMDRDRMETGSGGKVGRC